MVGVCFVFIFKKLKIFSFYIKLVVLSRFDFNNLLGRESAGKGEAHLGRALLDT